MEFYPARQIFLPIECLLYKMTPLPALYDSIDTMAASNKQTLAPAQQGKAWQNALSPSYRVSPWQKAYRVSPSHCFQLLATLLEVSLFTTLEGPWQLR